jgi:hypothetical protein
MEIVIRAAVMFLFLWAVTRAVGRSTLGELSTFELLLYVTLGDLVQQSVTQQDYSVTSGVLAISVFALLTVTLNWTQWRFPGTRSVITGKPLVIVRDGEVLPSSACRTPISLPWLASRGSAASRTSSWRSSKPTARCRSSPGRKVTRAHPRLARRPDGQHETCALERDRPRGAR